MNNDLVRLVFWQNAGLLLLTLKNPENITFSVKRSKLHHPDLFFDNKKIAPSAVGTESKILNMNFEKAESSSFEYFHKFNSVFVIHHMYPICTFVGLTIFN